MSGFRIDVADLLAHPGARREVVVSAEVEGLAGSAATVREPVEVAVRLERIPDGIVVRGTVHCHWHAHCSYCLRELDEPLTLPVDELFERQPVEGETYPIEGHGIDLEQLVRDAVLLDLPLAPHCATPCLGDDPLAVPAAADTDPADLASDPRWAALSELEIP